MKMDISIPEHAIFFAGYLDAVGRIYTTDDELFSLGASIIPIDSSIENELVAEVIEGLDVADMTTTFEKAVSEFFGADPRQRLIFYLIEYFSWFEEFATTCKCKQFTLNFRETPKNYLVFLLTINDMFDVLITLFNTEKNGVKCLI